MLDCTKARPRMHKIPISLLLLILCFSHLIKAQSKDSTTIRTISLPSVSIHGSTTSKTVSTYHGQYINGVRPLTPGVQCVVWLPSPDTMQLYRLTTLTIPLHNRFTAGRLHVSFHAKEHGREIPGRRLSIPPHVISPPDSIPKRQTQVRLDLRNQHIQLPTAGVYVVLESLPTAEDEVFIRRAYIQRRKTKKNGSAVVQPYILTRRGTDTTTIWTSTDSFPKLRQSPAGYVSNTWMRWAPHLPYKREGVQTFRGKSVQAFDTVVMLELEPVE